MSTGSRLRELAGVMLLYFSLCVPLIGYGATYIEFRDWHVQSGGVWATGEIIAIQQCRDRHGNVVVGVVMLDVSFVDSRGVRQSGRTPCDEKTTYAVGQTIDVMYRPSNPGYTLTRADIQRNPGAHLRGLIWFDVITTPIAFLFAIIAARSLGMTPEAVRAAFADMVALVTDQRRGKRNHSKRKKSRRRRR